MLHFFFNCVQELSDQFVRPYKFVITTTLILCSICTFLKFTLHVYLFIFSFTLASFAVLIKISAGDWISFLGNLSKQQQAWLIDLIFKWWYVGQVTCWYVFLQKYLNTWISVFIKLLEMQQMPLLLSDFGRGLRETHNQFKRVQRDFYPS